MFGVVLSIFMLSCPSIGQRGHSSFDWDARRSRRLSFNQRVGDVVLPAAERLAIRDAVKRAMLPYFDLGLAPHQSLMQVVLASRISFIDLDSDGIRELIVQPVGLQSGCGATGNCPFWIFRKAGSSYRLILRSQAETFQILRRVGSALPDILVGSHDSGSEWTLRTYRFSEGVYSERACYKATESDVR